MRQVDERHLQRDNILCGHFLFSSDDVGDLLRKNIKKLNLLWNPTTLIFTGGKESQTVDQRNDNIFHVDHRMKLATCGKKIIQGCQVHFVRKDLNDALHEVLLRDGISAGDHLLQNARQHGLLVHVNVDVVQLRQTDQIGSNQ